MPGLLVVGGDSTIGRALVTYAKSRGQEVAATTRRAKPDSGRLRLDLAESTDTWPALPGGSAWIVCAAMARIAACDAEPERARVINAEAVAALAERARRSGSRIVFLSTDKVFDGSRPQVPADAPRSPKTLYGETKAVAERAVAGSGASFAIVRLTKVLSSRDSLFRGWVTALADGERITPFKDMYMAPVALDVVASALTRIAESPDDGIYQLSGPDDVSYLHAAKVLCKALGRPENLVEPGSADSAGITAAANPRFTSLDTARAREAFSLRFEHADDLVVDLFAKTPAGQNTGSNGTIGISTI